MCQGVVGVRVKLRADGHQAVAALNHVGRVTQNPALLMDPALEAAADYVHAYVVSEGRGRWRRKSKATVRRHGAGRRGVHSGAMLAAFRLHGPHNVARYSVKGDGAEYVYYADLPYAFVFAAGRKVTGKRGVRRDRKALAKAKAGVTGYKQPPRRLIPPTNQEFRGVVTQAADEAFAKWIGQYGGDG